MKIVPLNTKKNAARVATARALPAFWVSGKDGMWKNGGKAISSFLMMHK